MGNVEKKLPPRLSGTPPQKGGEGNPPLLVEEGVGGGDFKKIASFLVLIIFLLVGFFLIHNSDSFPTPLLLKERGEGVRSVLIAGQNIKVELALTPREQEQGLSARQDLAENEGMLFIFTNPGKYSFWMKDMNFPIDIIWLSEDLKVVYIKSNASPKLYPETYGPGENDGNAKYVLEVMSGFSDKFNLKVGDGVLFTY